jgi:hypothetical protein
MRDEAKFEEPVANEMGSRNRSLASAAPYFFLLPPILVDANIA